MIKSSLPYKAAGVASTTFPNSATTFAALTPPPTAATSFTVASAVNKETQKDVEVYW